MNIKLYREQAEIALIADELQRENPQLTRMEATIQALERRRTKTQ